MYTLLKHSFLIFLCSFVFQLGYANPCTTLAKQYKSDDIIAILSIDGGGVRGVIPARILSYIEKRAGTPISDMFDLVMGTSTGSIIATGLTLSDAQGKQRYSAAEVEEKYYKQAPKLFSASFWHRLKTGFGILGPRYDGVGKTAMLKENFGDFSLSDLRTHVIIPSYSITHKQPIFFDNAKAKQSPNNDYYLADLINGATAAPTFFPDVQVEKINGTDQQSLVDAAIFMNDPTMEAFIKANHLYPKKVFMILSLGTGLKPLNINAQQAKSWGMLYWANDILTVIFNANTLTVNDQVGTLYENTNSPIVFYQRYNKVLPISETAIDNGSIKNLLALQNTADKIIAQHHDELDEMIACLKYRHQSK